MSNNILYIRSREISIASIIYNIFLYLHCLQSNKMFFLKITNKHFILLLQDNVAKHIFVEFFQFRKILNQDVFVKTKENQLLYIYNTIEKSCEISQTIHKHKYVAIKDITIDVNYKSINIVEVVIFRIEIVNIIC